MICIKIQMISCRVASPIMCETGDGKLGGISTLDVAAEDMISTHGVGDLPEMGRSADCYISCCLG